mmetsp:Transcript_6015/g.4544  ORF Transcript_6015/g.4544 Transcript_6015/m.4544 type:complete len:201 (+) Transcript_6015:84-686(+)
MFLVVRPQYSNLVILMLIEIEPIPLSILKLEEVVVKTLLTNRNFVCCFLQTELLHLLLHPRFLPYRVQFPPLLDGKNDFADFPFFGSPGTFAKFGLAAHKGVLLLALRSLPELHLQSLTSIHLLDSFDHFQGSSFCVCDVFVGTWRAVSPVVADVHEHVLSKVEVRNHPILQILPQLLVQLSDDFLQDETLALVIDVDCL